VALEVLEGLDLPQGLTNSLGAKLDAALTKLQDGNPAKDAAAIAKLEAFINQVEAQRGKGISDEDADALIALAQNAIDAHES